MSTAIVVPGQQLKASGKGKMKGGGRNTAFLDAPGNKSQDAVDDDNDVAATEQRREGDTLDDLQGGAMSEGVVYAEILHDYQTMDIAKREMKSGRLTDSILRSALVQMFNNTQLPAQYFNALQYITDLREGKSVADNQLRKRNTRVLDDTAMIVNGGYADLKALILPLPAQIFFALDRYTNMFSRDVQFRGYYELVRTTTPGTQLRAATEVIQYDWGRLAREFAPPTTLNEIAIMFDLHSKYGVRELMTDLTLGIHAPFIKTIIKEIMFEMRLAITATSEKEFRSNVFNDVLIDKNLIDGAEYQKVLIYPAELLNVVKQTMQEAFDAKLQEKARRQKNAEREAQQQEKKTGPVARHGKTQAAQVIEQHGGKSASASSSSSSKLSGLLQENYDDEDEDDEDFLDEDTDDDSDDAGTFEEDTVDTKDAVDVQFHSLFEDEKAHSGLAKNYYRRLRQWIDILNYNVLGGMYELAYQDMRFKEEAKFDPVLLSALYPTFTLRSGGVRSGTMSPVFDIIFNDISNGIVDFIRYHLKFIAKKYLLGIQASFGDKATKSRKIRDQFNKEFTAAYTKFAKEASDFLTQLRDGLIGPSFHSITRAAANKFNDAWMTEADAARGATEVTDRNIRARVVDNIRTIGKIDGKFIYRDTVYDPEILHDYVEKQPPTEDGKLTSRIVLPDGVAVADAGRTANFVDFIRAGTIPEHNTYASLWEESEAIYYATLIYTSLMGVLVVKEREERTEDSYYERMFQLKAYADTAISSAIVINPNLDMLDNAYLWYASSESGRMTPQLRAAIKKFVETDETYSVAIMDKETQRKIVARDDANIVAVTKYLSSVKVDRYSFFRYVSSSMREEVFEEKNKKALASIVSVVHTHLKKLFSPFNTTKRSKFKINGKPVTYDNLIIGRDMTGRKELLDVSNIKVTLPELVNIVFLVTTNMSGKKLEPGSDLYLTPPVIVAGVLCEIMRMVRRKTLDIQSYDMAITNTYNTLARAGFHSSNIYFTTLIKTLRLVSTKSFSIDDTKRDNYTRNTWDFYKNFFLRDMREEYHNVSDTQRNRYFSYMDGAFKQFVDVVNETRDMMTKEAVKAARREADRIKRSEKAAEKRLQTDEKKAAAAAEAEVRGNRLERTRLQTQTARLVETEADEEESVRLAELARLEVEAQGDGTTGRGEKRRESRNPDDNTGQDEKRQRTEALFTQALIRGKFDVAFRVANSNPDAFDPDEHEFIMCHMKSLVGVTFDLSHAFGAARNPKYKHGATLLAAYLDSDKFKPGHKTELQKVEIKKGDLVWTTILGAAVIGSNWKAVELLIMAGFDPYYPRFDTKRGIEKMKDGNFAASAIRLSVRFKTSDKLGNYLEKHKLQQNK